MEYDIWIMLLSISAHFEAVTFGSNPLDTSQRFLALQSLAEGWVSLNVWPARF